MSDGSLSRAWAIPLGLAALSVAGLVLALVCDGPADIIAVALIVVPLVVIAHTLARRIAKPSPSTRTP